MKIKEILPYGFVSLGSIVITVIIMFFVMNSGFSKSVSMSNLERFGLSSTKPNSYVAKVGDYYLSTDEFNKEYNLVIDTLSAGDPNKKSLYLNDLSTKKAYLDNLINELVLVIDAYNQGYFSSSEWEILSRISLRKSLVDGFLSKKIDVSKIEVSDKEVEELYQKNKEYFRQNNISPQKAEEFLKSQIKNQKINQEISKYLQGVRDKLSIEKVEENIK
ncbi:MAG: SurA N-terminal domain-containing protein [Brevinematia bacterium]